jgi:WD40 repeat protein
VRVWSGEKEIRRLEGHTDWVYALAVGPDGTVYSGSADTTIRVWSGEVAPTSAPFTGTVAASIPLLWDATTSCTLGLTTNRFGCGRLEMGSTFRRSRGTPNLCVSFFGGWMGGSTRHHTTLRFECGRATHQLDHVVGMGPGWEAVLGVI